MVAGGIVLSIIVIVAAFLLLFDLKGFAERRATAVLGRPVTIAALHVRIFPLEVGLEDINVADTPVGTSAPANKPPFMRAAHVDAVVGFWRLLAGDLVLPHLSVEDGVARVERKADGTLTWEADRPAGKDAEIPKIGDLRLHGVKVFYTDPTKKTKLTLNLETREYPDGHDASLIVKGDGIYEGQPSTVNATGGSILTLRDSDAPYPIDGTLVSGPTSVTVKGTVVDLSKITGLNATLTVKGRDAADLYRIAGIALPPTPPYVIETHLDRDGDRWFFKNFKLAMGKSDISGELVWDVGAKTPLLTGRLHAKEVALVDLGGFIGAAPGEAKTPEEEKRQAADRERVKRVEAPKPEQTVATELVVPDKVIYLEKLNSMNAKVHFEAAKIVESNLPLDSMKVDIVLQDGVLTLKPLEFGADRGKLVLNLVINGRAKPVATQLDATVQRFPLERLIGKSGEKNTTWGSIGGHAEFHATGDSMHRILASSDGNVGFAAGGGQLSLFLVEIMGIDLAESVGILLTKDKPTQIRCIVGDFALENGKMTARTMIADTSDTIFTGNGSIDLGRETMDMRVHAKPKDFSPVTLRSKLLLSGTFAHPYFGPDKKALAVRGGIAAALGVFLTPLASLLVLVDPGGGKDANCEALFKEAAK